MENSATLVEVSKKLNKQMSKSKDDAVIKKNTLRFEQKLKSKTLIVKKNNTIKKSPMKNQSHYDQIFGKKKLNLKKLKTKKFYYFFLFKLMKLEF